MSQDYKSFSEFYPFYLDEHKDQTCRRLHVVGSLLVISLVTFILISQSFVWLWALPIVGYGLSLIHI